MAATRFMIVFVSSMLATSARGEVCFAQCPACPAVPAAIEWMSSSGLAPDQMLQRFNSQEWWPACYCRADATTCRPFHDTSPTGWDCHGACQNTPWGDYLSASANAAKSLNEGPLRGRFRISAFFCSLVPLGLLLVLVLSLILSVVWLSPACQMFGLLCLGALLSGK